MANPNTVTKGIPVLDRPPSKSDGKDGGTYIARDKDGIYIYHKSGKDWFKTRMEKI